MLALINTLKLKLKTLKMLYRSEYKLQTRNWIFLFLQSLILILI